MVERGEHDIVPYLTSVANDNAAMILKMAAGIDKDILPDSDILTEIRVEWWKDTQRWRYLVTEQFRKKRTHFLRSMISCIQPESNLACGIAHLVHKLMYLFGVKTTAGLYMVFEFIDCHTILIIDLELPCYFPIVSFTLARRLGMSKCCGHFARHSPQATHEDAGSPRCTGDIETV